MTIDYPERLIFIVASPAGLDSIQQRLGYYLWLCGEPGGNENPGDGSGSDGSQDDNGSGSPEGGEPGGTGPGGLARPAWAGWTSA